MGKTTSKKIPKSQVTTKADSQAILDGCYWDAHAADRAVRFIETFVRAPSGRKAGEPFKLFKWQQVVVRRLFGWKRPDGTRRFRTGFISVARQNGKSFLTSAICLYMLLADGEISPAVASAATSRQQASIIYENMAYAIDHNAKLTNACHLIPSRKQIKSPKNNGIYQSLSVEARSSLGYSFSCIIVDEIAFHQNEKLISALKPTQAAREQPLLLAITTAGTNFAGVGYDMYLYAKKVLDGVSLDTSFFASIYEASEGAAVDDEREWHKANPSIAEGTLAIKEFIDASVKAKHSTSEELQFRYFRLNRWTKGLTNYIAVDKWDRCRQVMPTFPPDTPIYLGCDFANSKDLTAITGVIPYHNKFYILAHAWAPDAAAEEREKQNKTRYSIFQEEGTMTITPGNGTDYRQIREYIRDLSKRFAIQEIIADPNYSNETLMELMGDGFTVYRFAQTARNYTDATKRLESLILDMDIVHDGNNLLRWQAQNLQVEIIGEDMRRPTKGKSADKIDNMVALIMALSRATQHDQLYKPVTSVYDTEGLYFLE